MQQVLQNIRNGELTVQQVPAPMVRDGEVLIANRASVVSAGTEKMVLELSKKSLLGKAKERPDHVRRVLEKIRNEGLQQTLQQVREKLDSPMTMGYSSAGVVLACGREVQDYKPGDHVASNGPHAEIVCVPKHLCARIPEGVSFEQGAFAVLGAIAMQGVRLSEANLGETVFVIGLGLIGQLAVGLLSAAGCQVIGTDLDASKCELALKMGAAVARPGMSATDVFAQSRGRGADSVLITASTKSNSPIELAAASVRQKGRVVLVGVVGLEIDRRPFYFKEAEFVVSCSYGPGRYDTDYEDRGHDYPAAWVRWTEQRNIQAVLDLIGRGRLDVSPLVSHRFPIDSAHEAYNLIESGNEPYLGIVLQYSHSEPPGVNRSIVLRSAPANNGHIGAGVLGAGNFARMVLLPAIKRCESLTPRVLCSAGGVSAAHSGRKLGFERATTDESEVFADDSVGAVFSITQHDQHCRHVLRAIESRKSIFVEKPLCLSIDELQQIEEALQDAGDQAPLIMVGFNRRFSPAARMVKKFFQNVTEPLTVSFRFNAGAIPAGHWTQNEEIGGGRIVGEACHGIDLATYLCGSPPVRVFAESIGGPNAPLIVDDQCFITLRHANGSISNIAYLAGGDKAFPKERVEVFGGGSVAVIDDFRSVTTTRNGRSKTEKMRQDKGHRAEVEAFASAITQGSGAPISWQELRATTLASILAVLCLREGCPFEIA
ncbi:MAG: bi-domain-containing oxidoreductase [Planctomycetes bacterium]|nr:bi-domain-containing oxidoreductase [Planctomycetota bacterium]